MAQLKKIIILIIFIKTVDCLINLDNYYGRNSFPNYDYHYGNKYEGSNFDSYNNPAFNRHYHHMKPFYGNRRCRHHNPVFDICCNGILHRKRGYLIFEII